jgi:hypothetical protein
LTEFYIFQNIIKRQFLFFIKICIKIFKIWSYIHKQEYIFIFLKFEKKLIFYFLKKIQRKKNIFNIKFVFYSMNLQLILNKIIEKKQKDS